ncbi:MAG: efflux RND transporter periplasmic adaptor subunit [Planctomycetota bacterium]|jgi:membrane fusion protein (multidrug efflux system)
MKTTFIIRGCLICLILVAVAFLALKATVWKGQPDSHFKEFKTYKPGSNSAYKREQKIEGVTKPYSIIGRRAYEAVPVEITRVEKRDIEIFLVNNCTLEPEKQVDILAKTSGIVKDILVEEGDYVISDAPLAKLDDEELLLELKEAKVRKENAEMVYKRSLETFQDNIISEEEVEDKKLQFDTALVELERKHLEYKYTTIESPIDGVIVDRNIEKGDNVKKDQMAFKVADFDPILARIYVPEKDLNKIEEGQTTRIISEFLPEAEFKGRVKMVSPVVDPESGTVKVTIEIAGLTRGVLRPGIFVSVYTIVGQRQDVLVIPKKALILEAEADEVFVIRDFIVVNVDAVEIGKLSIGDRVVCKQKKTTGEGVLNDVGYTAYGEIVDISRSLDDRLPSAVTVETVDVVGMRTNKVFDAVSFYNGQDTLVLQIKDIVFGMETKAFKTRVTLGFREGNNVEVLAGLKEGDRVITVGQSDVGHGANVIIVSEEKDIEETTKVKKT